MIDESELLAGRYRLVAQVGTGAMGVVWKALDEHLNRVVAVKQLLHPGVDEAEVEEANRRARREARITARLNHPHAIVVYDMVEHERKPYLIMEYLRSESLSTVLAERGPLPPAEVARIGSQIASALAAAHEVGIVHRDVKPGNVLLAEDGTAKITDFGISRAAGDCTVTATGVLIGTPAYLAPEVARGQQAGFPADVFSLGSTLYAAVEGTPPFGVDDNPLALLYRIVNNEIIPATRSGPLTDVLSRLLDCDLSRRPTMQQARDALAAVPTAPLVPAAAGTFATLDDPPRSASGSPATGSFASASLSVDPSAPTEKVALIGPGTTPWPPAERDRRPRHPSAVLTVAASLLVVGFMLVAALLNHRNDTAGPPPGTSSTTPGAGQNKPAPQSPPAEGDTGAAPVLATIPAPAPVSSPEPSRVPPSVPSVAPPPGPSGVSPSGSSVTPSPEPSLEGERVPNPDPSQVPDPELGPSPEPSPDPTRAPEDNPEPSPPSDTSGR